MNTEQRTIDKSAEFDQAAEHDHSGKRPCWCGFGVGSRGGVTEPDAGEVRRLRSRNEQLERDLADANATIARLENRIRGFQELSDTLSRHIDRYEQTAREPRPTTGVRFLGIESSGSGESLGSYEVAA